MGLDTIKDYGIDFLISQSLASMGNFTYPVASVNRKFRSVLVQLKNDVTVYGRMCKCIPITSHMMLNVDYVFEPQQFLQPGCHGYVARITSLGNSSAVCQR